MLQSGPKDVTLEPNELYIFESRHAPEFRMDMATWSFDKLCYVRQGTCDLITEESSTRVKADGFLLVPAGLPHRFADAASDPATLVVICFFNSVLQARGQRDGFHLMADALSELGTFRVPDTHRQNAIKAALRRMVFEQTMRRPGYEAMNWGLFLELIVMLARSAGEFKSARQHAESAHAFAQSLEFLQENFTEPVTVADLAAMAGVSYRHYTALFKAETGETVNAYLTRLRIEFAKRRLLETDNVTCAALDAGFNDLSHFYRVFKSKVGFTPGQFFRSRAADHP